nr:putative gustatory receptor 9a [Drosophila bipectinata]
MNTLINCQINPDFSPFVEAQKVLVFDPMSWWLEHCLSGYFQLLGLACGWNGNRLGRLFGICFLLMVITELSNQIRRFFRGTETYGKVFTLYFVQSIQSVSVAYRVLHLGIALGAIVESRRSYRLLEELPAMRTRSFLYRQFVLEMLLICYILLVGYWSAVWGGMYLENLRYAYSTQAVRGRYLQIQLLVERLDYQMELLLRKAQESDLVDYQTLKADYARLARLSRRVTHLYGFSLLLLNVLCTGDCLIVCNVYFMGDYLEYMPENWLLVAMASYVVLPTIYKLSTLCAACHRCVGKSKLLQIQLKDRPVHTHNERVQIEEFSLQIMQDPIQFEICGIYHLNLQTLAGVFFFMLEALVIFMQFVSLIRPPING